MNFTVTRQESNSRGELLLRAFFGWIMFAPHVFVLMFLSIWSGILTFISWWSILFTGRYPESFFEFQVGLMRWSTRVNLRMYNMLDGYPGFGLNTEDEGFVLDVEYPESLSRSTALLKAFFGWLYVGIPHGFILFFRLIFTSILLFLAFWAILFTGKYPENMFKFNVGTMRWSLRVNLYLQYMTDEYPPFTGEDDNPPIVEEPKLPTGEENAD